MFHAVPAVDACSADKLLEQGAVLLDVREDDEWAAGHAPRALHVPLRDISKGELPPGVEPGDVVVTVCRSGMRSAKAAKRLRSAGVDVHNLDGGMSAWARAGLPVRRDGGAPGTVA